MDSPEQKIDKGMTISDILARFPQRSQQLAQIMNQAGLHCIGCGAAVWETLEGGMLSHGKSAQQIDQLVDQLNQLLEQPLDLSRICLTERAAKKFQEIASEEGKVGWKLRFGDQAGGCNGFEYLLDFCEKVEEEDLLFESHGVEIVVNRYSAERLIGSEIDFIDGLYGAGFKISNPQARSSCGCGSSHNY